MKLKEAIDQLSQFEDDEHLFVTNERSLSPESLVYIGEFDEEDNPPTEAKELREFMDIWQVRDVIAGKKQLSKDSTAWNTERKINALLEYINNDA